MTELIKFQPWLDARKAFEEDGVVKIKNITEPPCKHCESFIPRVKTSPNGDYDGVVICTRVGGMMNDFSCFQQKGLEEREHTTYKTTATELMENKNDSNE